LLSVPSSSSISYRKLSLCNGSQNLREEQMSHSAKLEYLMLIILRYRIAGKKQKTTILNEFCEVCGYSRKYAIRVLKTERLPSGKRLGRKRYYDLGLLLPAIEWLWGQMGRVNSKKMKAALPLWIGFVHETEKKELFTEEVLGRLESISAATLERILKLIRKKQNRGMSATRPAKFILGQIPIQAKDWNVTEAGTLQADTVAHCGNSLLGSFVYSLTVTDIFTGWTENRAIWTKGTAGVLKQMEDIEKSVPFAFKTFKSDSGTEFINYQLITYFRERNIPVQMVRSRPYRKDDNCYVEQKNFTHVRELFGYERIGAPEFILLMNVIYKEYWNPLQNFFLPSTKLIRKTRIGARIKKEFEPHKTPYERMMGSTNVSDEKKLALKVQKESLNPFKLAQDLERKHREFTQAMKTGFSFVA